MGLSAYQAAIGRDSLARAVFLLPHDVRRSVFRRLRPHEHEVYATMRANDLGVVPGQTISLTDFDRLKCIFVHIPKCAGISVGRTLFGEYEGNHLPIPAYQLVFTKEEFDEYFKFSFVRNPWDRLVSAYLFMQHGAEAETAVGLVAPDSTRQAEAKRQIQAEVSSFEDFEHFVTKWVRPENIRVHEHFRGQHRFVCAPNGELQLDFVGRFESLDQDVQFVAERLGVATDLVHHNRTNATSGAKSSVRDMYTPRTRDIVAKMYAKDIKLFDYSFSDL